MTVLLYSDVQVLVMANFFRQMSDTLSYSLKIGGQNFKTTDLEYNYYVMGGAFSLVVIAAFSERVFKQRNKFFPLFVWTSILMLYQLINFIVSLFMKIPEASATAFMFGFIENSTTFYYLFLAPIMIAYERRASQEVTPAATIITINVVVVSLLDYILSEIVVLIVQAAFKSDTVGRIPVILSLIIAILILRKRALNEWH